MWSRGRDRAKRLFNNVANICGERLDNFAKKLRVLIIVMNINQLLIHIHMLLPLQRDQSGSGTEAGRTDAVVISTTNRQHRSHLLHVLHHLRHPWTAGSRYSGLRTAARGGGIIPMNFVEHLHILL